MNHAWSRSPLKLTHAYTYTDTFLLLWNLMGRSGSYLYGTCLTLKHIQAIEVAFPHAMPRTEEKGRCTATCHQASIDQMIHQRKIQDPRLQLASVNWVKCSEWLHVNVIVFHGIPYYSKVIIPYGSCIFPHRSQDFPVFGYLSIFFLFPQPSSNLISGLARLFLADIRRLQGQWLSPSRPTRRQRQRVRHLAAALLRRWCHRRYSSPGSQSKWSETHRQRSQLVVAS